MTHKKWIYVVAVFVLSGVAIGLVGHYDKVGQLKDYDVPQSIIRSSKGKNFQLGVIQHGNNTLYFKGTTSHLNQFIKEIVEDEMLEISMIFTYEPIGIPKSVVEFVECPSKRIPAQEQADWTLSYHSRNKRTQNNKPNDTKSKEKRRGQARLSVTLRVGLSSDGIDIRKVKVPVSVNVSFGGYVVYFVKNHAERQRMQGIRRELFCSWKQAEFGTAEQVSPEKINVKIDTNKKTEDESIMRIYD